MLTRTLAALTLGLVALPLAGMPSASASHGGGDGVRVHGDCGGPATWKLKAKHDDGRIELEAEVDSNHRGQVWRWTIKHDGSLSAQGSGTTRGASGSFSVERRMADLSGKDHFTFRAVRRATGAVCRGSVAL